MMNIDLYIYIYFGGADSIMTIIKGNGHFDHSSNPEQS